MAGFFKKVAKRFTGEARAERKQKRQDNRLRKKQAKWNSKADRDRIAEGGLTDRATIAAASGWNPVTGFPDEQAKGTGVSGSAVVDTVKELGGSFLGKFLGGGNDSAPSSGDGGGSSEPKKDNTMMIVLAAVAALFLLKKK